MHVLHIQRHVTMILILPSGNFRQKYGMQYICFSLELFYKMLLFKDLFICLFYVYAWLHGCAPCACSVLGSQKRT